MSAINEKPPSLTTPVFHPNPAIKPPHLEKIITVYQLHVHATQEECCHAVLDACRQEKWNLLEKCADEVAELTDTLGRSLLLQTIQSDSPNDRLLSHELSQRRISLQVEDNEGNTALHYAARKGDVTLLSILQTLIYPIDCKNKKGETPLQLSIQAGQAKAVQTLLENGANKVAPMTYKSGETELSITPIIYAMLLGDLEVVKVLMKGVNISSISTPMGTLLHLLVHFKQNKILLFLLQEQARECMTLLEVKDTRGETPFAIAILRGNSKGACLLHAYGANIETQNYMGKTPLHHAAEKRNPLLIEYLHSLGAQLTPLDAQDQIPLNLISGTSQTAQSSRALLRMLMRQTKDLENRPSKFTYRPPENLVFQGGGPKGLAYLGALRVLEKKGLLKHVNRLAGTSAGAITCTLVAFNFKLSVLENLLKETNLNSWLDFAVPAEVEKELNKLIAKPIDTNALKQFFGKQAHKLSGLYKLVTGAGPIKILNATFPNLLNIPGLCKGEAFRCWIENQIYVQTGISFCTFGELNHLIKKYPEKGFKHLHIFATKLGDSPQITCFSSENQNDDDLVISDAVRASMSIPGVFVPHTMHRKSKKNGRTPCPELGSFCDGGLIYNFPVEAFDKTKYQVQDLDDKVGEQHLFNKRTLGFSLISDEKKDSQDPQKFEDIFQLLKGIFSVYSDAENHIRQLNRSNAHRVIEIDARGVDLVPFEKDEETKDKLIQSGKRATKEFCDNQNQVGSIFSDFYLPRIMMKVTHSISLTKPYIHFVGRAEILSELDQKLLSEHSIIAFYGPIGIGKTETAIAFANNHIDDFSLIWFISCSTPEDRKRGYEKLARAQKIYTENDSIYELTTKVHQHIEKIAEGSQKRCLLIFDNITNENQIPIIEGCFIIVTGRHPDRSGFPPRNFYSHYHRIRIPPFPLNDSTELLESITGKQSPHSEKLIKQIGCNPLVIGQVANYIKSHGMDIESFLKDYEKHYKQALTLSDKRYGSSLMSTISPILDSCPAALRWIQLSTHLGDQAIPMVYLHKWFSTLPLASENSFDQELHKLVKSFAQLGLIHTSIDSLSSYHTQFIHAFESQSLREALGTPYQVDIFKEAIQLLLLMKQDLDFESPVEWARKVANGKLWFSQARAVSTAKDFSLIENAKKFQIAEGLAYEELLDNKPKQALSSFNKALLLLREDEYTDRIKTHRNIGKCYLLQSMYDDALASYKKSQTLSEQKFGKKDLSFAKSSHGLALCYFMKHMFKEALLHFEQVLTSYKDTSSIGNDHLNVAICLINIAECHRLLGLNKANTVADYDQSLDQIIGKGLNTSIKSLTTSRRINMLYRAMNIAGKDSNYSLISNCLTSLHLGKELSIERIKELILNNQVLSEPGRSDPSFYENVVILQPHLTKGYFSIPKPQAKSSSTNYDRVSYRFDGKF